MRWKAIMYDNGCKQNGNVEKYEVKEVKGLSAFEDKLISRSKRH